MLPNELQIDFSVSDHEVLRQNQMENDSKCSSIQVCKLN